MNRKFQYTQLKLNFNRWSTNEIVTWLKTVDLKGNYKFMPDKDTIYKISMGFDPKDNG